ncbi:MAG: hypothetical protein P4L76_08500 [Beijerinckiaceae bacterium]|nr:hypothetical protein [Beijerinckiaceae bacterium]
MSLFSSSTWNVGLPNESSSFGAGSWVFISAVLVAFIAPMVAHESKIAEFRQNWINELRKDIAEYAGICRKWYRAYNDDTSSEEKYKLLEILSVDATTVLWRIKMRINPLPNRYSGEDSEFLQKLDQLLLLNPLGKIRQDVVDDALESSRLLLKREWEVTKGITPHWLRSVASKIRRLMPQRPV